MLKRKKDWYLGAVLGVRSVALLQVPKSPGNLWEFLRKSVHRYNLFVKKQQKVSHFL